MNPRLSLSHFVFVAVFLGALTSGARMLGIDSDLGRHLTLGNYILEHRIIPTRDLFSHTLAHQPRPPYEWLSQVLFALSHRWLELDGVILLTAVVIATSLTLTYQFTEKRSKAPFISLLFVLLAIASSSIHWLPRPHIFTFLLLAIWIEQLEQIREGRPFKLIMLPLLMLLWANLHGGFLFGVLAWLAYCAGWLIDRWRGNADARTGQRLFTTGILSLFASILTPDLWHNWEAVLNNRSIFILSRTVETMPPTLTHPEILPFTLWLVLTVALTIINLKKLPAAHLFLIIGFGFLALSFARNIPLFVIACTPITTELAAAFSRRSRVWMQVEERFGNLGGQSSLLSISLVAVIAAAFYFGVYQYNEGKTIFQFNPQVFPVQAVDWLEKNPQEGKMFNEFNWGGYLLYRLWPQQLVFLDSQSDFYGEDLLKEYEEALLARGDWENILAKYEVAWILIPTESPLAKALNGKPNWKIVYRDEIAVVFVKP